jgi:ribose-phosphate pyrophosphokinase
MKYQVLAIERYEHLRDQLVRLGPFESGQVERQRFPDGELGQRLGGRISGEPVILLGGTVDEAATLELFDLACGVVQCGAASLTLVIPYFGYSTQERSSLKGEVVTAKARAILLSAIPPCRQGNRVVLLDLHNIGATYYFEGSTRSFHISARSLVLDIINSLDEAPQVLACTDAGRAKWVESIANAAGLGAAFVFKRRVDAWHTEISGVSAEVKDQHIVIFDDMIRTGGSLLQAAEAYKKLGASRITAIATHGVLPGNSLKTLLDSGLFAGIHVTDSHPNSPRLSEQFPKSIFRVHSTANLIAAFITKDLE